MLMSLWNAKSVNPDTVSLADIAEVCTEIGIATDNTVPVDFFEPDQTYRRHGDTFRCLVVDVLNDEPIALGYLPVNLGGVATWEFGTMTNWSWRRGWTKVEA
jgi:hypothetical protein